MFLGELSSLLSSFIICKLLDLTSRFPINYYRNREVKDFTDDRRGETSLNNLQYKYHVISTGVEGNHDWRR